MNTLFELSNVSFAYKDKKILKNINLNVEQGISVGIAGESGSGKTTLLLLLLRLLYASSGTVSFNGIDLKKMKTNEVKKFRALVQPVFQDPYLSLDPTQKVGSIIAEPLATLHGIYGSSLNVKEEKQKKVLDALHSVGLEDDAVDRLPSAFSGGQRQRIAIARSLITNPSVLIADEAVSALDIVTKIEILKLLQSLRSNKNFTLIFVSHDLGALQSVTDRIIRLKDGGHL
ncbi:MAG: hypothetical protein Ta2B_08440 [Termitinemataceae bacterium]|nr:MAG: hypothetical protein Ta2B_08440 [Termitinemataceae bacterium]